MGRAFKSTHPAPCRNAMCFTLTRTNIITIQDTNMFGSSFNGRLSTELTMVQCIGHAILWFVIIICTFGTGAMFYPYALARFVINRTVITQSGRPVARLVCEVDFFSQLGHLVIWLLLSIVTFGLAYLVFLYGVGRHIANNTRMEPLVP